MPVRALLKHHCPRTFAWFKRAYRSRTFGLLKQTYRFPLDFWKPKSGSILNILEAFCSKNAHACIRFIQIGANNGNDEFAPIRRKYHWAGVMIEPQKDVFDELVRSNQDPQIAFEQVAIANQECEKTLYKISFSKAPWATTLASFDKSVIEKHIHSGWVAACAANEGVAVPSRTGDYFISETVRCTTLRQLVEKHHIPVLSILLVDTEGHDHEIVKQIEELEIPPRVVLFEHVHLSSKDFRACVDLMKLRGYRLYSDGGNTIGVMEK